MSSYRKALSGIGLHVNKPNFGIRQDPLNWKKLKGMKEEERNAEIIKRANLFTMLVDPPGVDLVALIMEKQNAKKEPYEISKFKETKTSYSTVPSKKHLLAPPLTKLAEWFPSSKEQVHIRNIIYLARQKANPSTSVLALQFGAVIAGFQTTALCKEIKKLTRKLFQEKKIKKMVAFGLGFLSSPNPPQLNMTIRLQTQHATLLAIRDVWKESNKGSFEIFLQDPQYSKQDEEVAAKYGMTVVCPDIGYQMGWLKVDEETLFVDFIACFPVYELIFEITRLAAILNSRLIDPEDFPAEARSIEQVSNFTVFVN